VIYWKLDNGQSPNKDHFRETSVIFFVSVTRTIQYPAVGRQTGQDSEGTNCCLVEVLYQHLADGTEEKHENFSQDGQ
jgi:hypothetical protein